MLAQEEVVVGHCQINGENFESLAQAVSSWPHLSVLDLERVTDEKGRLCVKPLADSLSQHSSLKHFRMLGCSRSFEGPVVSVLLPALTANHCGLRHLDITSEISHAERGLQSAVRGLSEVSNLTVLRLSLRRDVARGPRSAEDWQLFPWASLADALPQLCDLRELCLCKAPWGRSVDVLKSISTLTRLTTLHLDDTDIDASTAPQLAHSLRCLHALQLSLIHI